MAQTNAVIATQQTEPASPVSLLNVIERASRDSTVDVAKLQALLDMQERVTRTQAKQEFTQALSAVAAELEPVARDARNPHLGTRYAKLETIDAALRPIYSKHGFSVRYGSAPAADGQVHVTCTLSHVGGHSETLGLAAPIDAVGTGGKQSKTGIQAIGSTVTYLRRYLLAMALNVTFLDDDDDGESSRGRTAHGTGSADRRPDPKAVAWKDKVIERLAQAQSEAAVDKLRKEIASNYGACKAAWPDMAAEIDAAEHAARERIRAVTTPASAKDDWETPRDGGAPDDAAAELVAEVAEMSAEEIDGLAVNAAWRAKLRALFPPDIDLVQEAIEARKIALRAATPANG